MLLMMMMSTLSVVMCVDFSFEFQYFFDAIDNFEVHYVIVWLS